MYRSFYASQPSLSGDLSVLLHHGYNWQLLQEMDGVMMYCDIINSHEPYPVLWRLVSEKMVLQKSCIYLILVTYYT